MKAAIERTNDFKNYIVTTQSGQEVILANIDEAINLKNDLKNKSAIMDELSILTEFFEEQIKIEKTR